MRKIFTLLLIVGFPILLSAQMVVGVDTLYGNEWIQYDQEYYKIQVSEDGLFRLSGSDLAASGVPIATVSAQQYQVFHLGQEVPIYVSTSGNLSNTDYINFVGKKNRTELESFLFSDSTTLLNPEFSLFTDTSAYFLTWQTGTNGLRYENIENDTTSHPSAEPYFLRKLEKTFVDYWAKKEGAYASKFSHFDVAEGFATSLKTTQSETFSPIAPYSSGPDARLHVRYAGRGADHHQEISINNNLVTTDEYGGWEVRSLDFAVSASALSNNVSFKMNGLVNGDNVLDRSRLSYLSFTYPQTFDFEGQSQNVFELESASKQYLEISNFDLTLGTPILYDFNNNQRFEGKLKGNLVAFLLPQTTKKRQLVLVSGDKGLDNEALQSVNFIDYASANSDYLMISNARLFNDGSGHNYVQDYADYRASTAGGSYNPLIVEIQQIYDQFGYGIQRNPIGIRNMAQWAVRHWTDAKFLYLLGKGRTYNDIRSAEQLAEAQTTFFVPTFGSPGGDNLFVSSNYDNTPRMAVGRLAVTNSDELQIYLEKVIAQELNQNQVGPQTIEAQAWKKKVIHLGGGGNIGEQNLFKSYLNQIKTTIETNKFGGDVYSFFRTGTDPIQDALSDDLFNRINSGVSIITFLGHAGTNTFDFRIDNPDNYDNVGKYPALISLGCYSGNLFTSEKGLSERFCFYENKGAILFGATSALGYSSSLKIMADALYSEMGGASYGKGIGEIQKAAFTNFRNSGSFGLQLLFEQFNFHGDPALRINPSIGTDYMIDPSSVSFIPEKIDAQNDSFEVEFAVANIGYQIDDSISVKIEHLLPDSQVNSTYSFRLYSPAFSETYKVKLPSGGKDAVGENRLFITVDFDNEVEENPSPMAELNNELEISGQKGIPFFIIDNSAIPILPLEFAIVDDPALRLLTSTTDALAKSSEYIFEMDTTATFNSGFKIVKNITQSGGLIEWQPNISWEDGKVYYWRISPDSLSPDNGYVWSDASFVYLAQAGPGWNQSHRYQFEKDQFNNIQLDSTTGNFEFADNFLSIGIKNKGLEGSDSPEYYNNTKRFGNPFKWTIPVGFNVVVIDSLTGQYWFNPPGGINNPTSGSILSFPFKMDSKIERAMLLHFLKDSIPAKHYVMLYSAQKTVGANYFPDEWASDSTGVGEINLFNYLESQGAIRIRELEQKGSVPYVMMYRKNEGLLSEGLADDEQATINVECIVPGYWFEGSLSSTIIGPATTWESLELDVTTQSVDDIYGVNVFGINTLGDTIQLDSNLTASKNLTGILATEYPFIFLEMGMKDLTYRTAAQINYWRVHYQGVPEAIINPTAHFVFESDTLSQGDPLLVEVGVENISRYDMDSMLVDLTITDNQNNSIQQQRYFAPLKKASSAQIAFQLPSITKDLKGQQQLQIEINPNNDQPEGFHFNNFLRKSFIVKQDGQRPVLDVRFDGMQILNGDLVSAEPEITISLDDENENPYFRLDDTSYIQLSVIYPNGELKKSYFSQSNVHFEPATSSDNIAKVTFNPVFEMDGLYQLIVNSKDASGNISGIHEYKVAFEIISESMISNVVAYPNPFSTGTKFAYTLTGSSVPEVFTIRIMTVSGKVVREITQTELGELRIGKHLTDYVWDGTDEFGSPLANGVYIYQLVVKNNGESIKKYQTGTDDFFKKDFGKLVIMR